jgi:hypothetical protein
MEPKTCRIEVVDMLITGNKVYYLGKEAVVLNAKENEVLIFIDKDYVKWVDVSMVELEKSA